MFGGFPVVFGDTEFGTLPNGRIDPHCAVFLFEDGTELRLPEDELRALKALPFDVKTTLFVCYSAGAEIGVFLELGLAPPHHVCDLYPEFLAIANGRRPKGARSRIIEAMAYFGLEPVDVEEKTDMRALAMRGGPYTAQEMSDLLEYCAGDVYALKALLGAMADDLAKFHIEEILFRGRFMVALARSHRPGVPVDTPFLRDLEKYSPEMAMAIATEAEAKAARLAEDDPEHYHAWGIYKGARFTEKGYKDFLTRVRLPDGTRLIDKVPTTPTTDQPTSSVKELIKFAGVYPPIVDLCECMGSLDALAKFTLQIDTDDCVRLFERPFGSTTARSTKSFFSFPKWVRPAVKPPKGWAVAYLDARAQEHLISGTKSGDPRMIADYLAGDVHQALVDQLGLTESNGKKPRDRAKTINHAISYGQSVWGLAQALGVSDEEAAEFAKGHERARQTFYQWRKSIVNGLKHKPRRTYFTVLGWPFWTGRVQNERSMMNHPVQGDASDWMRVVMIAGTEAGILIVLSAHDGFLILSPEDRLEADIAAMTAIMQVASEVMFGIPMFVDCDEHSRAVWPNRLVLGGKLPDTWNLVQRELARIKQGKAA